MKIKKLIGSMFCLLASGLVSAEQSVFESVLALDIRQVNNANRAAFATDEIDELQLEPSLSLLGEYQYNPVLHTAIDYKVSYIDYGGDSQENDSILVGSSQLNYGNDETFYQASLEHSSRSFLVDPSLPDVSGNRDERDITQLSIGLKSKASKANQWSGDIVISDIGFDESPSNDSFSQGLDLRYTRTINPLTKAGLNLSAYDIEFENNTRSNYDYVQTTLFFERRLRHLDYFISAGLYQVDTLVLSDDSFLGQLDIHYHTASTVFSFSAKREITDTSRGNDNDIFFSENEAIDARIGTQDQVERQAVSLSFDNHNALCTACRLGLNIGLEDEQFFIETEEDSEELFVNARLDYPLNRQLTLNISARHAQFDFTRLEDPNNYTMNNARLALQFHRFFKRLNMSVFVQAQERNFERSGSYSTDSIGLNLAYVLL